MMLTSPSMVLPFVTPTTDSWSPARANLRSDKPEAIEMHWNMDMAEPMPQRERSEMDEPMLR